LTDIADGDIISKNEITEFKNIFPDKDPSKETVYGTTQIKGKETVVSYSVAEKLGLDIKDVLGKTLSIRYTFAGVVYEVISGYKVVGVLSPEFLSLASSAGFRLLFYVRENTRVSKEYRSYIYLDNFKTGNEVLERVQSHFKNSADIDMILYNGQYLVERMTVLENQRSLVNRIMGVVGVLLLIALIVNLTTVLFYDIKRKGIYFGVMAAEGMTRADIFGVIFFELFFIFMLAVIIAGAFSAGLMEIVGEFTLNTVRIALVLNFTDYLLIGIGVFGGGLVFLSLLSFVLLKRHLKRDIVRLF
jgi:ABC-type antimicrobial peptide transport system permease subunit